MPHQPTDMRVWIAAVLLSFLGAGLTAAAGAPDITATPVPGQLEVMQGTAVKLGGAPPEDGPRPESYRWDIVQGEGGRLYDGDRPEAIFQAPAIGTELELFVIRLTVDYADQPPAHSTIHIRVHRKPPETAAGGAEQERSIEEVMTDYYRRERAARDAERERSRRSEPVVISHTTYSGFYGGFGYAGPGWGWGYGWGWPARYPIYAPIVVPPPGIDVGPGDGGWGEPIAVPYEDLVTTFPGHLADDYLPQDFPGAGPLPDAGAAAGSPTDFIDIPAGVGGGWGGPAPGPGTGPETDVLDPMIDPGFEVDVFDW